VTWCALIGWSHVFGRRALEYTEGRVEKLGSCVELKVWLLGQLSLQQ